MLLSKGRACWALPHSQVAERKCEPSLMAFSGLFGLFCAVSFNWTCLPFRPVSPSIWAGKTQSFLSNWAHVGFQIVVLIELALPCTLICRGFGWEHFLNVRHVHRSIFKRKGKNSVDYVCMYIVCKRKQLGPELSGVYCVICENISYTHTWIQDMCVGCFSLSRW